MTPDDLLRRVQSIRAADFDWPLPEDRIATHPLATRDACRLLTVGHGGVIAHSRFSRLDSLLDKDTLLIYNDTRVINARLIFRRATGGAIEVFCLEPHEPADYSLAFAAEGECRWKCLVGRRKRWKEPVLALETTVDDTPLRLEARLEVAGEGAESIVRFSWTPAATPWGRIVDTLGTIPIPPYLGRDSEASDATDYQTVYSRPEGSVAAPTAGLHFTSPLLDRLRGAGVECRPLTLHVGAGTFRPVKSHDIGGHPMHRETFCCDGELLRALEDALYSSRPVCAVGTTAVRTLESLYRLGLRQMRDPGADDAEVGQWEPYTDPADTPAAEAIGALRASLEKRGLTRLTGATSIIIAPGYRWHVVGRLITNFHQPQSTLLLLVSSFLGDNPDAPDPLWRRAYSEALGQDYRFLSYGDAMLLDGGTTLPTA